MSGYGSAAVAAVIQLNQSNTLDPVEAWRDAVRAQFPHSQSMQDKGCPKGAFLGLCSEGYVAGVPSGNYTGSIDNKRYAIKAASLIRENRNLIQDRFVLWRQSTAPTLIRENGQIDVVLALWDAGLLIQPRSS